MQDFFGRAKAAPDRVVVVLAEQGRSCTAGALAQQAGIAHFFALGDQSAFAASAFGSGARHFDSMSALEQAVCAVLPKVGSVLVKGSRFMKMEQVVQSIEACADKKQGNCEEAACC